MFIDAVIVGIAGGLALVTYILKRNVGVVLLALMAGALVGSLATQTISTWLVTYTSEGQLRPDVLSMGITLLPVVICWVVAPKTIAKWRRLVGAVVLAAVAISLLGQFMGGIFASSLVEQARLLDPASHFRAIIVLAGLLFALVDLFLGKGREKSERRR
jgi:hypothetical protein